MIDVAGVARLLTGWLFLGWLGFLLVFGLSAAWLATERGRGTVTWLAIGSLIGPLALVLLWAAPLGGSGLYVDCWRCLEPIRRAAAVCRHCGAERDDNPVLQVGSDFDRYA